LINELFFYIFFVVYVLYSSGLKFLIKIDAINHIVFIVELFYVLDSSLNFYNYYNVTLPNPSFKKSQTLILFSSFFAEPILYKVLRIEKNITHFRFCWMNLSCIITLLSILLLYPNILFPSLFLFINSHELLILKFDRDNKIKIYLLKLYNYLSTINNNNRFFDDYSTFSLFSCTIFISFFITYFFFNNKHNNKENNKNKNKIRTEGNDVIDEVYPDLYSGNMETNNNKSLKNLKKNINNKSANVDNNSISLSSSSSSSLSSSESSCNNYNNNNNNNNKVIFGENLLNKNKFRKKSKR
jgi:hypothetical protein